MDSKRGDQKFKFLFSATGLTRQPPVSHYLRLTYLKGTVARKEKEAARTKYTSPSLNICFYIL